MTEKAVPLTDPMSKRSHRQLRDVAEFSRKLGRKSIGLSPASLLSLLDEIDEAREAHKAGRDGLDVARLTRVLWNMVTPVRDWMDAEIDSHRLAALIANEYAALTPADTPKEPTP